MSNVPEWLTVEEAARVLRIGRTKAYALTREWRATGGRSGLPVADLGDVLRVPRRALEELIEATLPSRQAAKSPETPPPARSVEDARPQSRPRRSRRQAQPQHQLTLIDLTDPAS